MKDKIDILTGEAFSLYPDANRIAVQNFCGTADKNPMSNYFNIQRDADLYNWNIDTVEAINYVLRRMME